MKNKRFPFLRLSVALAIGLAVGSCGYAPTHDIPAKPAYIRAGVKPGDTIIVRTANGDEITSVVTEIGATEIVTENATIPIGNIDAIAVRSWQTPEHPCGAGEPVGCSIPEVVLVLSDQYKSQADKFHGACVTHDFCYRHGFATYGTTRASCDENFYEDMKERCGTMGPLSVMDVKEYTLCQAAARQTYEAVRRYGESAYRTTTGTVCEYQP